MAETFAKGVVMNSDGDVRYMRGIVRCKTAPTWQRRLQHRLPQSGLKYWSQRDRGLWQRLPESVATLSLTGASCLHRRCGFLACLPPPFSNLCRSPFSPLAHPSFQR
eukprot:4245470-Pleurochrysis_carterae.AAC.1